MKITDKKLKTLIAVEADYDRVDTKLEPHVLTDKDDVKVVGCRVCKRPCVVTRFATAAKVACKDHRDRAAKVDSIREFDRSLETHVLTDKDQTKEVPCRVCGRPCIVNVFASAPKVACEDHRETPVRKTTTIDENGYERVTTHVPNKVDLEWSEFMREAPIQITAIYTDEEIAQREKLRKLGIEQQALRAVARNNRATLEFQIGELNDDLLPKDLKADERKKLQAKLDKAEKDLAAAESVIQTAEALVPDYRHQRDVLHRQAWLRAVINRGWTIKGRILLKGNREVTLPSDYLDAEEFAQVTS